MIAAVKGWHAAWAALLFFMPPGAPAAEDANGAARELARRTAAFAAREPVTITCRNASSLPSSEFTQTRASFDAALRDSGGRLGDGSIDARITLSENAAQYLLVEEARKGDDRQVWIASWKRPAPAAGSTAAVTLEKRMLWEQDEPMLDVAVTATTMLILSPSRLTRYERQTSQWAARESAPLPGSRPWPRDPRGHIRVTGTAYQAFLPGFTCAGAIEPALTIDCKTGEEPWVLESGSRAILLGIFAATRNYFDGRVTTQAGIRKTVPPFYSAAAIEDQGRTLWLLALVDGRTQLFDASLDPLGILAVSWGSDIAGSDLRCGAGPQVLATRAGDSTAPDGIQAFAIVNRETTSPAGTVEFAGPVVALWGTGTAGALAIVRNSATGRYEAYTITLACA